MSPDMFIRKICHDLRAPLRALTELPEWLEEDLVRDFDGLPDCSHETLRMMKTQSKRLDEMVAGLSSLIKVKRSGPANASMPQVLSEMDWADDVYLHLDVEKFPMESTHVSISKGVCKITALVAFAWMGCCLVIGMSFRGWCGAVL